MKEKMDTKKIIVLVLIIACIAMFFMPWIRVYFNFMGNKITGYDILDMEVGYYRESRADLLEDLRKELLDMADDAAYDGVRFNGNAAFRSAKTLLKGNVSPINLLSISSFASGFMGSLKKAYKAAVISGEFVGADYWVTYFVNAAGKVTAVAVVLWILMILFVAAAVYAIYGWIKDKKYAILPLAIIALLWVIVAAIVTSSGNNIITALGRYGIIDLEDTLENFFDTGYGRLDLSLFHFSVGGILCVILAVAAFAVSRLAPSLVDVGVTRAASSFADKVSGVTGYASGLVSGKWKCPTCGSEMGSTFAFCTNCGTARPVKSEKKKCCNCGKVLPDDTAFCPYCGTSVGLTPPPVPAPISIPVPDSEPVPSSTPVHDSEPTPEGIWQRGGDDDL